MYTRRPNKLHQIIRSSSIYKRTINVDYLCPLVYDPREDSYLIQGFVKKYAVGRVLDMGTGTGILAATASKSTKVRKVVGADIDSAVITYCKNTIKNKKASFVVSNLFSTLKQDVFDTIIFNPPYLPQHPKETRQLARMLSGGKHGFELIEKFLQAAPHHLAPNGQILLLFSSLTNKGIVDQLIEKNGLQSELLGTQKFFMETLYCYRITKNSIIKRIEHRGVKHIQFLAHGKRGVVYTAQYKNKKVAIKIKRKESAAQNRLQNEARWLNILNKHHIGPRLLFAGKDFIVYEFVRGIFFPAYTESHTPEKIKKVITDVFNQCFTLDKLGITKEEMHHPHKHIIIGSKATLIDFERTHKSAKPKNVTQFVQYLCNCESQLIAAHLYFNPLTLRRRAQSYKKYPDEAHLQEIIDEFQ